MGLIRIEQSRFFKASAEYEPLYPFAIGLLVFAFCSLTHANLFLAAFAAGVTVTSVSERFRDAFHFAAAPLLATRPLVLGLAFVGSGIRRRELMAAA